MFARTRPLVLGALAALLGPASLVAQTAGSDSAALRPVSTATAPRRDGLITPEDIKAWNTIRQNVLSNDGRWFAYVVAPTEGNATVVYRGTARAARETRVSVGEGGGSIAISGDSKWLGYIVAPPRQEENERRGAQRDTARDERRDREPAEGDSVRPASPRPSNKFVLVNLATGETKEFERIRRFSFDADRPTWVALTGYGTAETPGP